MSGPVVLLLGMALVAVAATATTFLLRPEGRIDACITWGVVAIVYVVGTMLLLGVTGLLRPGMLLAAHAAEAIVAVAVLARRGWPDVDVRARVDRGRVGRVWLGARAGGIVFRRFVPGAVVKFVRQSCLRAGRFPRSGRPDRCASKISRPPR